MAPPEVVKELCDLIEPIVLVGHREVLLELVETGEDVDGVNRERAEIDRPGLDRALLHLAIAGRVPELVGKVASLDDLIVVKFHIGPCRRDPHETEAQGVGTELGHEVERVRRVAELLRHLAAFFVANDAGEKDVFEGHFTLPTEAGHDHAGDPEENDVGPGHEIGRGVELFQGRARCFVAFIHRREGPEPAREPGVKDVLIADPLIGVAGRVDPHVDVIAGARRVEALTSLEIGGGFLAIPDRNLVSPPELAADAPVLDAFHPVGKGLLPPVGAEVDLVIGDGGGGLFDAGVLQKPLHGNARLDRDIGALAEADTVLVVLDLHELTHRLELFRRFDAGLEAVHALKLGSGKGVKSAVGMEDVDDLEVVFQADRKVVFVMRRGHLEHARPELGIDVIVGDDGDFGLGERTDDHLPDEIGVAFVLRIHRHGRVAHERLGPRRRDLDPAIGFTRDAVAHVIELRLLGFHDDLFVAQRGERLRAPVHHPLAAVDESFVKEIDKDLRNPAAVVRVHREALALPVARAPEALELLDNDAAVLFLPLPDLVEKGLAAHVPAGLALLFAELLLDLRLRRDAGVVRPGEPKHILALHPGAAGEDILNRVVEDVTEVENPRDIRRGDDDGVGRLLPFFVTTKTSGVDPAAVPLSLDITGLIAF